jgi:hypothetical protein
MTCWDTLAPKVDKMSENNFRKIKSKKYVVVIFKNKKRGNKNENKVKIKEESSLDINFMQKQKSASKRNL